MSHHPAGRRRTLHAPPSHEDVTPEALKSRHQIARPRRDHDPWNQPLGDRFPQAGSHSSETSHSYGDSTGGDQRRPLLGGCWVLSQQPIQLMRAVVGLRQCLQRFIEDRVPALKPVDTQPAPKPRRGVLQGRAWGRSGHQAGHPPIQHLSRRCIAAHHDVILPAASQSGRTVTPFRSKQSAPSTERTPDEVRYCEER